MCPRNSPEFIPGIQVVCPRNSEFVAETLEELLRLQTLVGRSHAAEESVFQAWDREAEWWATGFDMFDGRLWNENMDRRMCDVYLRRARILAARLQPRLRAANAAIRQQQAQLARLRGGLVDVLSQ